MLAQFSTEKLVQMKVSLFLTDYAAWEKLSDFLNPPLQKRKTFSKNWMDAARAKLHDQIAKDGYTPDLLQEAQQLMQQATSK